MTSEGTFEHPAMTSRRLIVAAASVFDVLFFFAAVDSVFKTFEIEDENAYHSDAYGGVGELNTGSKNEKCRPPIKGRVTTQVS